jgi:hypothetical protein
VHVDWYADAEPIWQSSPPRALYDGETVHLFAQFATPPSHPPQLRWKTGDAAHTLNAQTLSSVSDDSLPRLAGAKKLDEAGTKAQREALALRYQLVSTQTSLFLVHVRDAAEKAGTLPTLHQVPQMLAAGWGGMGTVMNELKDTAQRTRGGMGAVWEDAKVYFKKVSQKAPARKAAAYHPSPANAPSPAPCYKKPAFAGKAPHRPTTFTLGEAAEETRVILRHMLVETFSKAALHTTDFAAIVAQLSTAVDADTIDCIAAIARQTAASEEDVWAMLLDYLIQSPDLSHLTPSRQASRLLRKRLKAMPPETQQAITATRDFSSLCVGA